LASYAAFHDWDGIYFYTLGHDVPGMQEPEMLRYSAEIWANPVAMTNLAAGALLFLRGDVRPARRTVFRSYSEEEVKESLRLPLEEKTFFTPGFSPAIPLQHTTRIQSFHRKAEPYPEVGDKSPLVSDTGEIVWAYDPPGKSLVSIDTDKSQALIGYVRDNPRVLKNLSAAVNNEFCSIALSSLDGESIASADRLLLVATSRSANTGQTWEEDRRFMKDWGTAPTRIEPVTGTIRLHNLKQAQAVELLPLDGNGVAMGKAKEARKAKDGFEIPIGTPATTWYLVKVVR
jgi:hypothetical protein